MREMVVYLGPTLSRDRAREILPAEYLPPIRRGDLLDLPPSVHSVAIIDGEFYQSLAVSPKEILAVIRRGVRVYGASSMGALRAAELHTYGMVGIGKVFEAYREEWVVADDEVALAYDPLSYQPVSEPLINLRFSLDCAVERGLISRERADQVLQGLKSVWFPERSWALFAQLCPELSAHIAEIRHDVKAEDALLLLRTLGSMLPCGIPPD